MISRVQFAARSAGQVLILFVLFLLVMLGISALAVDFASWLVVDRNLQNVADHAALAGASEFEDRTTETSCVANKCENARAQAWTSLNDELGLGLNSTQISNLAASDTGANGLTGLTTTDTAWPSGVQDRVWVATPPPTYAAYVGAGGHYQGNHGVVFARVDRAVRSFLGGALGITPGPRTGWATAGALPTDFALQVFCRNNIAPENGVCVNSAALTIDGQGGIRLLKGDIGSNESMTVTANVGRGVIMEDGNVFLVNRACAQSTWRCPNGPPSLGGINDGLPSYQGKNAFYIAPLPVPQYESPLDEGPNSDCSTASQAIGDWCVPFKDQGNSSPSAPGDWTCVTSGSGVRCGTPLINTSTTPNTVVCQGAGGGNPPLHYYPVAVSSGANTLNGLPAQSNGNEYLNIDDSVENGDPDTGNPPPANPSDYVYTDDIAVTGGAGPWTRSFIVNLGPSGPRLAGDSTVRYVVFKTFAGNSGNIVNGGNEVILDEVRLLPASGSTAIAADTADVVLDGTPRRGSFTVNGGLITDYNTLRLEFRFKTTAGSSDDADERGGGVSWAEIQHPGPQPALPAFIPPGYYRSIDIPAGGCAILDPLGEYSSLEAWQMPGIYRFGGGGSPNDRKVKLGDGAFLIGDGVTFVFDANWPDSGSNQGVAIGANGALVLNTQRVPGTTPPCTPSYPESLSVNQSSPLGNLQYSAVCAAWGIDNSVTTGIRPGQSPWPVCDAANAAQPQCSINRTADYDPITKWRGVTFFFTPPAWPPSGITNRFEMQGGSGNDAGLAFRGVLYAPYDDVKITGGNGFNTVGQVLAWTAMFNGGSAYIDLDYPYDYTPAQPYLLEPTITH